MEYGFQLHIFLHTPEDELITSKHTVSDKNLEFFYSFLNRNRKILFIY